MLYIFEVHRDGMVLPERKRVRMNIKTERWVEIYMDEMNKRWGERWIIEMEWKVVCLG
jgi:hypothetical protein